MSARDDARRAALDLQTKVQTMGKSIGPVTAQVFAAIEGNAIGEATWAKICKRTGGDSEALKGVITRISRAAQRAALSSPEMQQKVKDFDRRYGDLLRCAEKLRDGFPKPMAGFPPMQEHVDFQRSINWAVEFLEQFTPKAIAVIEGSLPRSRKKGEKAAFEKHLCEEFQAAFGLSLHEAVVCFSNALYPDEREATKELVAKNDQAERAARSGCRVED